MHVGARRGSVAALLAPRLPAGRVTAVVPEPGRTAPLTLVARGHQRGTLRTATPVEVVRADPRFLPFEYAGVDAVVAGLDRLRLPREVDRRQVLRELVRVVRHGRRLAVVVEARDLPHTEAVLHEVGTQDIRSWRSTRATFPSLRVVTATRPPHAH